MTDEERDEMEYRGYVARLENQRHGLARARDAIERAEKQARVWLDEINITKIRMRPYEERGLTSKR
jgi:hypothetical protein